MNFLKNHLPHQTKITIYIVIMVTSAVALNLGNEGNKAKLLGGYGWEEATLRAELDKVMTAEDWVMVQDIWDLIDTLWPEIAEINEKTGKEVLHVVDFDGSRLASGLYMYQVTTKDQTITRQMTLLK